MTIESEWLDRIQQTMAVDIGRFQSAGLPPKAIVTKLFEIPEVAEAFELRATRRVSDTKKLEQLRDIMRRYLPPDSGVSDEEFISEVLGVLDSK